MADLNDKKLLELCLAKRLLDKNTATEVYQQSQRDGRPAGEALVETGVLAQHTVDALYRELEQDLALKDVAGFRILRKLGQGGMGTVYLAEQTSLRRQVALKVVAPQFAADAQAVDRFMREARTAAAVNHPNIISVIDVGYDQGQLYMALELVTGGDAAQLAARFGGALPEVRALEIINDCCRGLQALFEARLIHRDIKPANIFITKEGVAKLADLGLARSEQGDDRLTASGHTIGTPAFMSPEQASGKTGIDIRSDLYSLGATLFALTTGSPPFSGNGVFAIAAKLLTEPAPDPRTLNPGLSEATCRVVARCLAKHPKERFQSPQELSTALTEASAIITAATGGRPPSPLKVPSGVKVDLPTPPTVPSRKPRSPHGRPPRGGTAWLTMGMVTALMVMIGVAWVVLGSRTVVARAAPQNTQIALESASGPTATLLHAAPERTEPSTVPTTKQAPLESPKPRDPVGALVTDGLIAYWPFDEGSGNRAHDRSGKAVDGTIVNAVWGPGKFGTGLIFTPPSKVLCGDLKPLAPHTISVTCWLMTTAPVKALEPISIIRHDGHFNALQLLPDGDANLVTWALGHVSPATFAWDGVWNDGRWHHFAVTYHEVQGAQVFKDGKIFASLPKAIGTLQRPTAPFVIGGSELDCEYFTGSLDEVRIYDRVLTAGEITTLASAPTN